MHLVIQNKIPLNTSSFSVTSQFIHEKHIMAEVMQYLRTVKTMTNSSLIVNKYYICMELFGLFTFELELYYALTNNAC